jgi:hypothetical protein
MFGHDDKKDEIRKLLGSIPDSGSFESVDLTDKVSGLFGSMFSDSDGHSHTSDHSGSSSWADEGSSNDDAG